MKITIAVSWFIDEMKLECTAHSVPNLRFEYSNLKTNKIKEFVNEK